jgi:hypothetical protein
MLLLWYAYARLFFLNVAIDPALVNQSRMRIVPPAAILCDAKVAIVK